MKRLIAALVAGILLVAYGSESRAAAPVTPSCVEAQSGDGWLTVARSIAPVWYASVSSSQRNTFADYLAHANGKSGRGATIYPGEIVCYNPASVPTTTTTTTTSTTEVPTSTSSTVATSTTTTTIASTTTTTAATSTTTVAPTTTTVTPTSTTLPATTTTVAPTTTVPSSGGFPDTSNTGVPSGVTLTAYTGSMSPAANTVITGKIINGCLQISQPGVVVRNSRISCTSGYAVDVYPKPSVWMLIEDSEIDCGNGPGSTGVGEEGVTVRRTEITRCENGFDLNSDMLIEDNYIHNLYNAGASHADGIQVPSSPTGTMATIRHNTIVGQGANGANGTSAIIASGTYSAGWPNTGLVIDGNYLVGGAFTLYCPRQQSNDDDVTVTNNVFEAGSPAYGYSDDCVGTNWSGNTLSNGQILNPS